jgi:hypothetical protein
MKTLQRVIVLLAIWSTCVQVTLAQAQQSGEYLRLVPAEAEFVLTLDVPALMKSPAIEAVLDRADQKRNIYVKLDALKNMTGVDLRKDIERVDVFGVIDREETVGIRVKGTFDEDRLLPFIQLNNTYEQYELAGRTIHNWADGHEEHFVTILEKGHFLMTQDEEVMEVCLASYAKERDSFLDHKHAKTLLDSTAGATVCVRVPHLDAKNSELGEVSKVFGFDGFSASLWFNRADIDLLLTVIPDDPNNADKWKEFLEGATALGALQRELPLVAQMMSDMEVTVNQKTGLPEARSKMENSTVMDVVNMVQKF